MRIQFSRRHERSSDVHGIFSVEPLEARRLLTSVSGFSLINADTETVIGPLLNKGTIDFAKIGTHHVNIVANSDATTASVRFGLDANANYAVRSAKPFALAGYTAGDYLSYTPTVGAHTVRATPFLSANAIGRAGVTATITFNVIDTSPTPTPSPTPAPTPTPTPAPTPTPTPAPSPTPTPSPTPAPTPTPTPTPAPTPTPTPAPTPTPTPPPTNVAPTVTLVNPIAGVAAAPGYYLLRATAADIDGTVSKVEFYANGSLLGTTTAAPYLSTWRNVPTGVYSVTAKAYDNLGATSETAPVSVTIVAPAPGATWMVSTTGNDLNDGSAAFPFHSLNHAWQVAQPGDSIVLQAGTYYETLSLDHSGTATQPIQVRAQTPGTVVLDGADPLTGLKADHLFAPISDTAANYIWVSGITFRDAANKAGTSFSALRTGTGWHVEDCTVEHVDGNGVGLFGAGVTLRHVISQDNGCVGIGGTNAKNSLMLDCISRRNNTAGYSGSFEGGGGKFTRVDGLLVDNYDSYSNWGPGIWFDYNNVVVTVQNSTFHNNMSLLNPDGSEKIGGTGIFWEISGLVEGDDGTITSSGALLAQNNLMYDNDDYGITVYASANVTLQGNTLVNDGLQLKDGGRSPFATTNLTIVNNFFKNSRILTDTATIKNYTAKNFVINGNTYDNPDGRLWKWNGVYLTSLAAVRALGFELTGRIGRVTYTPLLD